MKKLLVIGGGFLQTFVIKKAKELGYYVLCVDKASDAPGFALADEYGLVDIIDQEACLQYAQRKEIDGVLTAATDYGVLSANYVAEQMGLVGNSYSVAQIIKNKYSVRKVFNEKHIDDTPESIIIGEENIDKLSFYKIDYPVMVKPCDGSGSRGATKVVSDLDIETSVKFAIRNSLSKKAIIEKFIVGDEYGVESLVNNGKVYVQAVMKKRMTQEPYYAELGHEIPNDLSKEVESRVINIVEAAIKALGIVTGGVNMDLLITKENSIHIIDVGARMGGNLIYSHIIPIGTGIDYVANVIRTMMGDSINLNPIKTKKAVATRLLALQPGIIKELPNITEIEKKYGVEVQHHMHIGDKINEYHTNLDGMGYVVSQGENIVEVISRAIYAKNNIDQSIKRNNNV